GHVRLTVLGVLVAVLASAALPASASEEPRLDVDAVAAALKNRRDRVRSARFYWSEHRVEAKGWGKYPGQSKDVNPKGLTIPEEDLAYELESSLLLDQNKWRYDLHNRTWRPESKKLAQLINLKEMRISPQQGIVEGRPCVILEMGDAIGGKLSAWVD